MISAPITDMTTIYSGSSGKSYSNKSSKDSGAFGDIISSVSIEGVDVTDSKSVNDAFLKKSQEMNSDMANMGANSESISSKSTDKASNADNNDTTNKDVSADNNNSDSVSGTKEQTKSDNLEENKGLSKEETEEISDNILKEVADDLGISTDELEDILSNLGISPMDLSENQNLISIIVNVKADGDMMAIATDENLGSLLSEISEDVNAVLQQVSQDLGISFEELMTKIKNTDTEVATDSVAVNDDTAVFTDDLNNIAVSDNKNVIDSNKDYVVSDKEIDAVNVNDGSYNTNEASLDSNKADDLQQDTSKDNSKQETGSRETLKSGDNNISVYAMQQDVNQISFNDVINEIPENGPAFTVNQSEIISQIEEHMRLQLKNGITELQMQLNPETLGTVNLTLSTRENGVTAQLTAQNESVKQALESQIVVLKENLEQQGVKVEAVEVTVASHEFERNLDKGDDRNESQQQEEERLRKATRKLNLGDILADDNIEALEDELQVTAKMMKADGTSMDYKV